MSPAPSVPRVSSAHPVSAHRAGATSGAAVRAGLFAALLAVPVLAATAWVVGFAVLETVAGETPLSRGTPRNIAEAAGMTDAGEFLRLRAQGQDATWIYDIRPEVISSQVLRVNALEAAVWSRQIALVELVDREGLIPDAATRRELACLAEDIGASEIAHRLAPEPAETPCDPGQAMARVFARNPPDPD